MPTSVKKIKEQISYSFSPLQPFLLGKVNWFAIVNVRRFVVRFFFFFSFFSSIQFQPFAAVALALFCLSPPIIGTGNKFSFSFLSLLLNGKKFQCPVLTLQATRASFSQLSDLPVALVHTLHMNTSFTQKQSNSCVCSIYRLWSYTEWFLWQKMHNTSLFAIWIWITCVKNVLTSHCLLKY